MQSGEATLDEALSQCWAAGLRRAAAATADEAPRWAHFLCVWVPMLAAGIVAEVDGAAPAVFEAALTRLERAAVLLRSAEGVLGCKLLPELRRGLAAFKLLPEQPAGAPALTLVSVSECTDLATGLDPEGAARDPAGFWGALVPRLEALLASSFPALLEGLYARGQLLDVRRRLRALIDGPHGAAAGQAVLGAGLCAAALGWIDALFGCHTLGAVEGGSDATAAAGALAKTLLHPFLNPEAPAATVKPTAAKASSPLVNAAAQAAAGSHRLLGAAVGRQLTVAASSHRSGKRAAMQALLLQLPAAAIELARWLVDELAGLEPDGATPPAWQSQAEVCSELVLLSRQLGDVPVSPPSTPPHSRCRPHCPRGRRRRGRSRRRSLPSLRRRRRAVPCTLPPGLRRFRPPAGRGASRQQMLPPKHRGLYLLRARRARTRWQRWWAERDCGAGSGWCSWPSKAWSPARGR